MCCMFLIYLLSKLSITLPLNVLFFQSCYKYYSSDDISKDGDGMDEQCRLDLLYFIF